MASPRPAVTVKSLSVNKLFLVGWKLKRFFLTLGNFVAKVSKYNPVTDSYQLFYPVDNHEEWLSFSEVVKMLPKSWARDEERANVVAVCYHLTSVAADEKLSTNPAQVAATYTEPLKYQDADECVSRRWAAGVSSRSLHFLPASSPSCASGC
jgi:hypothetical protein